MANNPYAAPTAETALGTGSSGWGQPQDWSIGEVISLGFRAVLRQPGVLIGGPILVQAVSLGISFAPMLIAGRNLGETAPILETLVTPALSLLWTAFITVGSARVHLAAARGEPVEFGDYFSGGDRFGSSILTLILMYAGIFTGFLLLLVPGLILALAWSMSLICLADTDVSPTDALRESYRITKGHRLAFLGFGLASGFVLVAGFLALGVGLLVAFPAIMVAFAAIYVRISGRPQST